MSYFILVINTHIINYNLSHGKLRKRVTAEGFMGYGECLGVQRAGVSVDNFLLENCSIINIV